MNVSFWGLDDFPVSYSNRDTSWTAWNRHSGSFMVDTGPYSAIWSLPLTNVKWHSDPWPTVTSKPIRLSTNFITLIPNLSFTEFWVVSLEHLQRAWHASRERLPFQTPVPSPFGGLACAPIVETRFLELSMSLLDFSPWIPLGTFYILLVTKLFIRYRNCFTTWPWSWRLTYFWKKKLNIGCYLVMVSAWWARCLLTTLIPRFIQPCLTRN